MVNCRAIKYFRLEGSLEDHLTQPSAPCKVISKNKSGCLELYSTGYWKTSKNKTAQALSVTSFTLYCCYCGKNPPLYRKIYFFLVVVWPDGWTYWSWRSFATLTILWFCDIQPDTSLQVWEGCSEVLLKPITLQQAQITQFLLTMQELQLPGQFGNPLLNFLQYVIHGEGEEGRENTAPCVQFNVGGCAPDNSPQCYRILL